MSEHTQGKLIAKYEWLVPEAHQNRPIGNSSNPIHDRDNYAQVVAQVRGRYHDQDANACRLAAAWNHFDGVETTSIEAMPVFTKIQRDYSQSLGDLAVERDCALSELAAARALLREVVDMVSSEEYNDTIRKADAYLDACDTPGEPT